MHMGCQICDTPFSTLSGHLPTINDNDPIVKLLLKIAIIVTLVTYVICCYSVTDLIGHTEFSMSSND